MTNDIKKDIVKMLRKINKKYGIQIVNIGIAHSSTQSFIGNTLTMKSYLTDIEYKKRIKNNRLETIKIDTYKEIDNKTVKKKSVGNKVNKSVDYSQQQIGKSYAT